MRRYEDELLEWFRARHGDVFDAIRSTGNIPDEEAFEKAIANFSEQFGWEQAADQAGEAGEASE